MSDRRYRFPAGHVSRRHLHGEGVPIVFLHGNPTSSYIWRTVIPAVTGLGHFVRHRDFLDALLAQLGITENVIFVLHDWAAPWGSTGPGATHMPCGESPT